MIVRNDHCEKRPRMGLVFHNLDRFGTAFASRLTNHILVFFGNGVEFHDGFQLILVIFENIGAKVIAISVAHALTGDRNLHVIFSLFGELKTDGWSLKEQMNHS
ncbi:hypothetical protein DESC_70025 [Desulfosarcina cetonica]|nr:hypothetical protein DESC_70025 [Desulfosarcina cetonica]